MTCQNQRKTVPDLLLQKINFEPLMSVRVNNTMGQQPTTLNHQNQNIPPFDCKALDNQNLKDAKFQIY